MADDNQWKQPAQPPPPLFAGKKERDFVKQVSDELLERVVGQQILYYPVNMEHTDFHPIYGEATNKSFLPPLRVFVLVDWEGHQTTTDKYGVDKTSSLTLHFHNRRLTEDQDLYVREGDFVKFGEFFYEIVSWSLPDLMFGQVNHKMQISAKCIRAREGVFNAE
jgi:hypothetical protein|tara:strand:+ start:877 stop:1368 length:492 start_codon:yes stop_codon:yes gene_type:complete